MTTPVMFPDPQRYVLTLLKAAIAELDPAPDYLVDDNGDPVTASVDYPDGATGSPIAPHFQVRHDGTPDPGIQIEGSTIGLITWYPPGRETDAKDAASWAGAVLAAAGGWCIRPVSGRLPGFDRDSELYYVATEWRVRRKGVAA